MPSLPGRHLARSLRAALRPLLTHRYTRTSPVVVQDDDGNPIVDTWGNEQTEDGTPVTGLRCLSMARRQLRVDGDGRVLVDVPTLTVPYDDPLAVGDTVSNVVDADGTVLVAAALVESFDPSAEAGASVVKVAILRGATTVS